MNGRLFLMGQNNALNKDERKYQLKLAYQRHQVVTISSGARYLNLSYNTIKRYALEMKLPLFDDRSHQWLFNPDETNK